MTSTTDDSPSKIAVNSLAHTTEVQRESGFQVILDPVVPAPFSAVLLALAIPMFSGKEMATASILPPPMSGGIDGGNYQTLTKKRRRSSPRLPANHKQDVVTLGLEQLEGTQCPLRHVWWMAESIYWDKIEIKKEEGRNGSGWAARNICCIFIPTV